MPQSASPIDSALSNPRKGTASSFRKGRQPKRKLSDDLDDNVLVSMVTTWVNDGGDDVDDDGNANVNARAEKRPRRQATNVSTASHPSPDTRTSAVYSVHVTQIPYTATDMEIRQHFYDKGILISSLRMVYDRGVDGRRQFRGVGFVDFADEKSYKLSLTLHKSTLLGRRINVRPTKSKVELTDIVAATNIKVAQKIRKHKDEKDAAEGGPEAKKLVNQVRNRKAAGKRIERKERKKAGDR
jgi:RNA recognition motif-containing protein